MNTIKIETTYPDSAPLSRTDRFSTAVEARIALARWVRACRRDLNIILFREGPGRFFVITVNGAWEGTRELT